MSQEEKVETKVVTTKVEVSMKKILHYSQATVNVGADTGKNYIARNLSCMEKWSPEDISKIFNGEGNLKGISNMKKQRKSSLTADNPTARADMVKNTRKHVIARDIKIKTNFYCNRRKRMKLRGHNKCDARIILSKKILDSRHLVAKKTADGRNS